MSELANKVALRGRIPERGETVRVHVLGRPFQLGERSDGQPAGQRVGMVDFE